MTANKMFPLKTSNIEHPLIPKKRSFNTENTEPKEVKKTLSKEDILNSGKILPYSLNNFSYISNYTNH